MEESKIISNCKVVIIGGSAGSLKCFNADFAGANPKLNDFAIVIVLAQKKN